MLKIKKNPRHTREAPTLPQEQQTHPEKMNQDSSEQESTHVPSPSELDSKRSESLADMVNDDLTDKWTDHSYLPVYEELFAKMRHDVKSVLDIGFDKGGSMQMWRAYFPNAVIYGLEQKQAPQCWDNAEGLDRICLIQGVDAYNKASVEHELNQLKFDLVVDDGAHTLESLFECLAIYLPRLKPGGILVLEAIQDPAWFKYLKLGVPPHLKPCVETFDLRVEKKRWDDLLFLVDTRRLGVQHPTTEEVVHPTEEVTITGGSGSVVEVHVQDTTGAAPPAITEEAIPNARRNTRAKQVALETVCVEGRSGLANTLFQIAAALHYVQAHPSCKLVLAKTQATEFGTAQSRDRDQRLKSMQGKPVSYLDTIFKSIAREDKCMDVSAGAIVTNDYHATPELVPEGKNVLFISGWNQHRDLVMPVLGHMFDQVLNVRDGSITKLLTDKYGRGDPHFFETCVLVGMRRGLDFAHMSKLTDDAYISVLKQRFSNKRVLLVCDCPMSIQVPIRATVVCEPDVVQFQLARLCPNMIVSESTFHVWMGYLVTHTFEQRANVVCFNNTDITRHNLDLPTWIKAELV